VPDAFLPTKAFTDYRAHIEAAARAGNATEYTSTRAENLIEALEPVSPLP